MAELMLKFLNWDLKALRSNLVFETITLKAIFDPQNFQKNRQKNNGNIVEEQEKPLFSPIPAARFRRRYWWDQC